MKTRVGVFFGGQSVEHEISILTALQVMHAFDTEKYDVVPVYVAKNGLFYSDSRFKNIEVFKDLNCALDKLSSVQLIKQDQRFALVCTKYKFVQKVVDVIDVAFNCFHGTNGEDGSFAGYCQMLGLPYTGSSLDGAVIGQDKVLMRNMLQANKIPICPWIWRYRYEYETDKKEILSKVKRLGYPVIVKPATLGSSIGISVVEDVTKMDEAIALAGQYSDKIVIEKKIVNMREFNCAYLGNIENVTISGIEEVVVDHAMLTYEDKYEDHMKYDSKKRILPAELDSELVDQIKYLTVKTCRRLHLSGVIRVDFLMDVDKNQVYVNEVNTIPGSLAYYLFESEGVSFTRLLNMMMDDLLYKERVKKQQITSYETNLLANYDGSKGVKGK